MAITGLLFVEYEEKNDPKLTANAFAVLRSARSATVAHPAAADALRKSLPNGVR